MFSRGGILHLVRWKWTLRQVTYQCHIGMIAEKVQGAVTGSEVVQVMHTL